MPVPQLPVSSRIVDTSAAAPPPTLVSRFTAGITKFATPSVTCAGTAAGTVMAAVGVDFVATWRYGYHHAKLFDPGVALTVLGNAGTLMFQALAPRGARDKTLALLGHLGIQGGVILNQVGDSHFDAATDEVPRNPSEYVAGAALAVAGAMVMLQALVLQTSGAQSSRAAIVSASVGFMGAVGGSAIAAFSASSAADLPAGRVLGLVAVAGSLMVGVRGLVRLAKLA